MSKQQGVVKVWNRTYGFISREDGDDLFVHHSQIQMEGYKSLVAGQRVEFDPVQGSRGYEAKNVVVVG